MGRTLPVGSRLNDVEPVSSVDLQIGQGFLQIGDASVGYLGLPERDAAQVLQLVQLAQARIGHLRLVQTQIYEVSPGPYSRPLVLLISRRVPYELHRDRTKAGG